MYSTRDRNPEVERLESEIEEYRDRERRDAELREEKRRQQRKEHEQEYRDSLRQADTWPEAFRKQRILIGPELRMAESTLAECEVDARCEPQDVGWWQNDVAGLKADLAAINTAERLYREEEAKVEEQIAALRAGVRANVVARLREQMDAGTPSYGFASELLEKMEKDDPEGWLNW